MLDKEDKIEMTVERLVAYQKLLIKNIKFYLNCSLYDKNKIFELLEELDIAILVISKKLELNNKARGVK